MDTSVAVITALVTFLTSAQIGLAVGVGLSLLCNLYRISYPSWAIMGALDASALTQVQDSKRKDFGESDGDGEAAPIVSEKDTDPLGAGKVALEKGAIDSLCESNDENVAADHTLACLSNDTISTDESQPEAKSKMLAHVYRDITIYEDAMEHTSILIFRFDGAIYFMVWL